MNLWIEVREHARLGRQPVYLGGGRSYPRVGQKVNGQARLRAFLAAERSGVIVNVSSVHQVIPEPRSLGYSMSKGGMQNLTRSLALEYAARGIRVNGIGPGASGTPINRSWIDDPVKRRMVEEHIPMRPAGGSEEMAAAVAFLCSDEAGQ